MSEVYNLKDKNPTVFRGRLKVHLFCTIPLLLEVCCRNLHQKCIFFEAQVLINDTWQPLTILRRRQLLSENTAELSSSSWQKKYSTFQGARLTNSPLLYAFVPVTALINISSADISLSTMFSPLCQFKLKIHLLSFQKSILSPFPNTLNYDYIASSTRVGIR